MDRQSSDQSIRSNAPCSQVAEANTREIVKKGVQSFERYGKSIVTLFRCANDPARAIAETLSTHI